MPKVGTDTKRRDTLADLFEASKNYVQQARALVTRAPDLAESVKAGSMPLAEAPSFPPS